MDQGEWLNLVLLIPGSLTVRLKNTAVGFVCAQVRSPHTERFRMDAEIDLEPHLFPFFLPSIWI